MLRLSRWTGACVQSFCPFHWRLMNETNGERPFRTALSVMPGTMESGAGPLPPPKRRSELAADDYVAGIRAGDRNVLARAITLVESNSPRHQALAQAILADLMPETGNSVRIGITGVPGAGKSSLIESLGSWLCGGGHKIAVLAVDPSSSLSRGSILGDKTRMETLARHPNAFIRPSPSGGTLGGVARKTRETVLLCEAFGFDTLILETVGVGQSEGLVRSMVDFFLLVLIAGAGDELQGIKKGVMELADAIAVNKADGENERRARLAKAELNRVLSFLQPATEGWETKAVTLSAHTRAGLPELWERVERFVEETRRSGVFARRRQQQEVEWLHALIDEGLRNRFYGDPAIAPKLSALEDAVRTGRVTAARAAGELLDQINPLGNSSAGA